MLARFITGKNLLFVGVWVTAAIVGYTKLGPIVSPDIIVSKPFLDVRYYGAKCDGTTDDTTAFQNALNVVRTLGGEIRLPYNCKLKITSAIDASLVTPYYSYSVIIRGANPISQGRNDTTGNPAIICAMTSGTICIDARSSEGLVLDGVNVVVNNASFTGYLLDFSHSAFVPATDSALMHVTNSYIGGDAANHAQAKGILISEAIDGLIDRNNFGNLVVAVDGYGGIGTYSNVFTIRNNQFLTSISGSPLRDPGEAWTIEANTFEGCGDANNGGHVYACALDMTVVRDLWTLNIRGNWFGDASWHGAWIHLYSPVGHTNVSGNFFSGPGGDSRIISSISRSAGSIVTVTYNSIANSQWHPGAYITISGVTDTSFNGTFIVLTSPSVNSVTYYQGGGAASDSTGTIVARQSAVWMDTGGGAANGVSISDNTICNLAYGGNGSTTAGVPVGGALYGPLYIPPSNSACASTTDWTDSQNNVLGGWATYIRANRTAAEGFFFSSSSGTIHYGLGTTPNANYTIAVPRTIVTGGLNLGIASGRDNNNSSGATDGDKITFWSNTRVLGVSNQEFRFAGQTSASDVCSGVGDANTANNATGSGWTKGACIGADGTVSGSALSGFGNASATHAVCWKTSTTLGYCSTQPDASGVCTCN